MYHVDAIATTTTITGPHSQQYTKKHGLKGSVLGWGKTKDAMIGGKNKYISYYDLFARYLGTVQTKNARTA